ncbi:MAG: TonB-dependent receptor [Candidatus Eisenbacteria bacterium]|uniref:TonB-dependent receptor n=1 Tax=Eiseniibacteriota bacterium TaxID=2212470 RepID=A0A849SKU7_UNCEI|nr:TonB-dependent receptor [Candidatus Eisenbacteria bacterium]
MLRRAPWAASLALLLALWPALAPPIHAGTTGKLTGHARNEKKEILAGVNIRVEGQRLGAVTDENGAFTIIGIPAGTYVVKANLLGYAPYSAQGVDITPDFTTTLELALRSEAVQMDEVRVDAERPLLQKDATSTTRVITAEQISRLPTRGYKEAAAQQSGIVNFQRQIDTESGNGSTLIIRGGRPNETAFFVDGFSQQDPLTGNATTSINNNAIQEVVVLNGGFSAEYGRIMSGVVNVITREGSDHYGGSLEVVTDNFGGFGNDVLGAKVYDYNNYDGSFGGPIIPGRDLGSFYYSGQRRWQGDRAPRSNFEAPLPVNSLSGWSHQAKLAFPLGSQMGLRFGGLFSSDDWREFLNTYRFNLAHSPRYEDINKSVTGQFNHTLSSKSFYTVGMNWFFTERKRGDGVYFDQIERYGEFPQADLNTNIPWFWPGFSGAPGDPLGDALRDAAIAAGGSGHVFDDYLRRQSQYWGAKADYTTQWNPYHQFKTGAQFDQHTLRFFNAFFPVNFAINTVDINRYGFSENGRDAVDGGLDGPRQPVTASYYLQDKYERSGVVVNAGIRYDYINVDTEALASEELPLGLDGSLDDDDLQSNKTYNRLSPRLGIGFPVTDRTVLHVNYGQFFQQPNLQDLYVSYRFLEHKIQTGGYFVGFGNPNLKPEQTTAYEVGIAHQINEFSKFDITAYYKDVKDLVQIATIASFPNNFSSYRNKDFATIKGVDLGYTMRRVNHVATNIAYSLSFALGTGSVSNTQRNIAWTAGDPPKQTAPLDFDQRHKFSVNLDYALAKGEGLKWGASTPFENVNVNVLYNVASGTPYTPTILYDEVTLAAVSSQPVGPLNSRYGPWTQSVDFKANKGFRWSGLDMSAYLWMLNAFDTENSITVYTSTGSPFTTNYLNTPAGREAAAALRDQGIDPAAAYGLALQNQALFSNPRTVRFGLRVGF